MIFIPHVLVGAVIGAKIKHIGWIIILGLISHLILDKIPHWDYGKKLEKLTLKKSLRPLLVELSKIGIDGLIGIVIISFIIWQKNIIKVDYLLFILIGITASLLPDFLLGVAKLSHNKFKKITKPYIHFHEKILHYPKHIRKPTPLGVSTQILVSIIAILILIFS